MTAHLLRDLERVKKDLLDMGGQVEEATDLAIRAILERRADLARQVLAGDDEVDRMELRLEDECLKLLALHQPVASDLRFIIAVMKVNNDLERVGDLALNIAERAVPLAELPVLEDLADLQDMGRRVRTMLRQCLDALVRQDAQLAREVVAADEIVDQMHARRFQSLQDVMRNHPESIEAAVDLLSVSRYLERIADHATNVAEDVVFMVEGSIIRHQDLEDEEG